MSNAVCLMQQHKPTTHNNFSTIDYQYMTQVVAKVISILSYVMIVVLVLWCRFVLCEFMVADGCIVYTCTVYTYIYYGSQLI